MSAGALKRRALTTGCIVALLTATPGMVEQHTLVEIGPLAPVITPGRPAPPAPPAASSPVAAAEEQQRRGSHGGPDEPAGPSGGDGGGAAAAVDPANVAWFGLAVMVSPRPSVRRVGRDRAVIMVTMKLCALHVAVHHHRPPGHLWPERLPRRGPVYCGPLLSRKWMGPACLEGRLTPLTSWAGLHAMVDGWMVEGCAVPWDLIAELVQAGRAHAGGGGGGGGGVREAVVLAALPAVRRGDLPCALLAAPPAVPRLVRDALRSLHALSAAPRLPALPLDVARRIALYAGGFTRAASE